MSTPSESFALIRDNNVFSAFRALKSAVGDAPLKVAVPKGVPSKFVLETFFEKLSAHVAAHPGDGAESAALRGAAEKAVLTSYTPDQIRALFARNKNAGMEPPVEELCLLFDRADARQAREAAHGYLNAIAGKDLPHGVSSHEPDPDGRADDVAKSFLLMMRAAYRDTEDFRDDPAFGNFAGALVAGIDAMAPSRRATRPSREIPEPVTAAPPTAPRVVTAPSGRPVRPKSVLDLLIDPHPPKEDMGAMMDWVSAQPWGTYSVGMDYPEEVLSGDDVMREQSRYSGDKDAFVTSLETGGRNPHAAPSLETGVGEVLARVFPAPPADDALRDMASLAVLDALGTLDPGRADTVRAAQGTPALSDGAVALCASMVVALGTFREMFGVRETDWSETAPIPLGDFGPEDRISARAVLGKAMFAHMCGRPLDDAVCDTLASVVVRLRYPDPEAMFGDEAFALADAFSRDPEGVMTDLRASELESPDVSM